jgi:hypothetical protein
MANCNAQIAQLSTSPLKILEFRPSNTRLQAHRFRIGIAQ